MKIFNVKLLYIYKFINNCLPIYAFYTILFIDKGMTVTDVALLIALWSAFAIVFEIPSGVLADRWNRRNMLAVASILNGICYVIWFFSDTFFMFALGFFFWAIAGAFTSGTEEGLIFDNLKSDGREESFTQVYGRANLFSNAGNIVGIASAGIISNFVSVEGIALLSAAICFINVIFILQIREKNFYSKRLDEKSISFFGTFKEASAFIKGSRIVLISILFLMLFANLGSYLDEFDALIINDFQVDHVWVSVILTIRFVFVALGDILAPIVQKRVSSIKQIFFINVLAFAFLTIFAAIWNLYAILIFGIAFMIMTISEILFVNTLQNEIKEEGRATVMSFLGIGQNIAMICLSLMYAFLTGIFTLQHVYIIISIYGIAGGLSLYLLYRIVRIKIDV